MSPPFKSPLTWVCVRGCHRVFVDVVNGEYVPRKSILKSRSREDSVCSDTSESSTADFDDRRGLPRSVSCDEATCSDTSESILEEEQQESHQRKLPPVTGTPEVRAWLRRAPSCRVLHKCSCGEGAGAHFRGACHSLFLFHLVIFGVAKVFV